MTRPLTSAIIPAYNCGSFLKAAVESVMWQREVGEIECIVVDDGSTDGSVRLLEGYADRIKVISTGRMGVAGARNAGARAASGEYFAFLDGDDVWLPRKLTKQLRCLDQNEAAAFSYTGLHLVDSSGRFVGQLDAAPPVRALRNTLLLENPYMTGIGSTSLIRRSAFEDAGGFDEQLSTSADLDLALRIALVHEVCAVLEPLTLYRLHDNQMHRDPSLTEAEVTKTHQKIFSRSDLPSTLARKRRRAQANLHISLAGAYLNGGSKRGTATHVLRALLLRPDRVLSALRRLSMPNAGVKRNS